MLHAGSVKRKMWPLFVVGGIGCIAPNIINYASRVMAGGALPDNTIGLVVGGVIFFTVAGFLVTYILEAKDIRDAFYKGVAVPTLIISLANGVTDKDGVPNVPAVPTAQSSSLIAAPQEKSAALFSPALVYAQTPVPQGVVRFTVSPKSIRNITVTLLNQEGNAVARAQSVTANFEIQFPEGQYTAVLESENLYKEMPIKVAADQTTMVNVELEEKAIGNKITEGVRSLLKKR